MGTHAYSEAVWELGGMRGVTSVPLIELVESELETCKIVVSRVPVGMMNEDIYSILTATK